MAKIGYVLSFIITALLFGAITSVVTMFLFWAGISFIELDWSLSVGRDERKMFLALTSLCSFFMLPIVDSLRKTKWLV